MDANMIACSMWNAFYVIAHYLLNTLIYFYIQYDDDLHDSLLLKIQHYWLATYEGGRIVEINVYVTFKVTKSKLRQYLTNPILIINNAKIY